MKRNNHFALCEIAEVPYLLPFGQEVADLRRGIQINSTGLYLWELLEKEHTRDELLTLSAAHFEASANELPLLEKDITQFLNLLKAYHMLEDDAESSITATSEGTTKYVKIAGLNLKLSGPAEAFSSAFNAFCIQKPEQIHQEITVLFLAPLVHPNGEVLLRSEDLFLMDAGNRYVLLFPTMKYLYEAHLKKDASAVTFYCMHPLLAETPVKIQESLFHAMRFSFLYLAEKHHIMALHSASLLYQDNAWLFSAHSGVGKSTHTNLWHKLLQTPLINGDLNLLAIENGQAVVHGLPWCGTSEIFDTKTYPLGGIILLKRGTEDHAEMLSEDQKRLLVMQRFISPVWTKEQLADTLTFADRLASNILICRLHCTKESTAVTAIKQAIDKHLQQARKSTD